MSAALRELLAKAKFGEFSVSGTGFLLEGKHMFGDGVYGDAAPALAALINEAPALLAKSAAYDALVAELATERDLHSRVARNFDHYSKEWGALKDLVEAAPVVEIEDVEIDGEVYRAAFDDDKQFAIGSRVRLLLVREGGDAT